MALKNGPGSYGLGVRQTMRQRTGEGEEVAEAISIEYAKGKLPATAASDLARKIVGAYAVDHHTDMQKLSSGRSSDRNASRRVRTVLSNRCGQKFYL